MYRDNTVGVVVPAYNEAGLVGDVLDGMPDFVDRVYAVDDASTDDTWAEIRRRAVAANARAATRPDGGRGETGREDRGGEDRPVDAGPRVVPIRHDRNRGAGGAVKTGYRRALADRMDVVAVVDGDGQMDLEYLDRIVDPVATGRADYAKGTRFVRPEHHAPMSRWRAFGNRLLTGLTRVATGYWGLSDAQNGYTAISRSALAALPVGELYDRYGFLNDVLAHLAADDRRVVEVPHPAVYREEESTIRYRSFVPRLSALLLGQFLGRVRRDLADPGFWPAAASYLLGAAALAVGLFGGATALVGADAAPGSAVVAGLLGGAFLLGGVRVDAAGAPDRAATTAGGESS